MSDKTCFKCGQPIEGGIPIAFHPGDGWAHPISMECDTRPTSAGLPCGCWMAFRYNEVGEREMRISPCEPDCVAVVLALATADELDTPVHYQEGP